MLPVADLRFQHRALEPVALPVREIGVLDGQVRERRGPPGGEGRVEGADFTGQNLERPAVGDDVMERQDQDMLVFAQPDQGPPNQRRHREVEGALEILLSAPNGLPLPVRLGESAEVDLHQRDLQRRMNDLGRPTVHRRKCRAQGLVASHDLVEARLQRILVQAAGETCSPGQVVGRSRLHPVQEPEPWLGSPWRGVARTGAPAALPASRQSSRIRPRRAIVGPSRNRPTATSTPTSASTAFLSWTAMRESKPRSLRAWSGPRGVPAGSPRIRAT